MNGGGNVWPMYAGVGPLVGDSLLSRTFVDGRETGRAVYAGGAAFAVEHGVRQEAARATRPHRLRHPDAPVAVLIDGGTGSSGEAVALAFRTRPHTRFFGAPTAGYTTANRGVALTDDVNLVVTTDPMTDADGRAYDGPLAPDEAVPMPARWWPSSADAVARRATAWVLAETACAATR